MAREPSPPTKTETETEDVPKDAKAGSARTKRLVTGAAIGIGSAALVAALLYANRARKSDKA